MIFRSDLSLLERNFCTFEGKETDFPLGEGKISKNGVSFCFAAFFDPLAVKISKRSS